MVLKNSHAIMQVLVHLLLLEPGTIQSHPEMGVGLVSKYRYSMEHEIDKLRDDFRTQIQKDLPQYQGVQVNCFMQDKICYITATIDNTIYSVFYDTESNDIKSVFKVLADL